MTPNHNKITVLRERTGREIVLYIRMDSKVWISLYLPNVVIFSQCETRLFQDQEKKKDLTEDRLIDCLKNWNWWKDYLHFAPHSKGSFRFPEMLPRLDFWFGYFEDVKTWNQTWRVIFFRDTKNR